jgi:predicted AAA+ superfamily ATPase
MLARDSYTKQIIESLEIFPICALLGARQVGKTTIAQSLKDKYKEVHHFDLEDPTDLAAFESPKLVLNGLKGLVIIDEVQRKPNLFPYLRTLVDTNKDIRLLILGSASRELIHQSSETLAGRIYYIHVSPFKLSETQDKNIDILWSRGGYPRSYLAASEEASNMWRKAYISTFLERDMLQLGFDISPQTMRRVWTMLAHYHANIMNYSEFSRSLSISDKTIKYYIDILDGTFMVRVLKPWFANISKRQVKAPKIYIRDSGILHSLLGIHTSELRTHPKAGASFEGFAIEEIIHYMKADAEDCYYWRTQAGSELDLLICKNGKKYGFEFKYTDSPTVTKSMYSAIEDLELDSLDVIVPGGKSFKLKENINVIGIESLNS